MCCYCVFQSVDSRFRCYDEIDTDAVLSLDEDVQLITDEVCVMPHQTRILVQVTIFRRLLIGRDGHLNQSEAYDIS